MLAFVCDLKSRPNYKMANEVKLECYTLKIREKRSIKYFNLDTTEGGDFLELFTNYIRDFDKELLTSSRKKKSLQFNIDSLNYGSTQRIISGIIESGDYGIGGLIKNINTGRVRLQKETTDSDIKPFYFLLSIPKDRQTGMLILQRFGIHGIKTVFVNHLKDYISQKNPNSFLEISPLVSKQLAKVFIEHGGIKEVSLRKYSLPTDIINSLGLGGYEEEMLNLEIRLIAKKNKLLPFNDRVKKFINDPGARLFDVKEFNELGFNKEHKTSVKVTHNGNTRVIDISDTGQIRPYYDIDKEVSKNSNNHPEFDSIDSIARGLIEDLNQEFGL